MSDSPTEQLELADRLCLALYSASRAMTARYRPILTSRGLTYPQYLVMLLLWEQGTVTVGDVGRRLRLDSGTLSPLLKRLEAMGLLSRQRDDHDERSVLVSLTEAGSAMRVQDALITDEISQAAGLSPQQQAELVAELQDLVARLEVSVQRTGLSTR